jgi:dephospho-CoA kinase
VIVLGLTGSIGMGKSTTAAMFAARGVPVFDADAAVHALYAGPLAATLEAAFPGVAPDGRVDRAALARRVVGDTAAMTRLEAIVHPAVRAEERRFLAAAEAAGAPLAVLDIPLLFETGAERRVDAVIVVSAPARVQRARVLGRPGMTEEKLAAILSRQMADAEKRRRADLVVPTGLSRHFAQGRLRRALPALLGCG